MEEFLKWLVQRSEYDLADLIEEFSLDRDLDRSAQAELTRRLSDIGVEV